MLHVGQGRQVAAVCLFLGLALPSGILFAQTSDKPTGRELPGIWHEGKHLGYRPPHLKRQPAKGIEFDPHDAGVIRTGPSPKATLPDQRTPARPASVSRQIPPVNHPAHASGPLETRHHHATEVSPLLKMAGWGDSPHFHDGVELGHEPTGEFFCPPHQSSLLWGRAEYLLWWTRGMDTPALASTSTSSNTPREQAGVLGFPDTRVLFGDSDLIESSQSGARFMLGSWVDADQTLGFEVTYLYVGEGADRFHGSPMDFPILARPFLDAQTNNQASQLINYPGLVQGHLDIEAFTEFQSLEALLRHPALRTSHSQLDYLIGYRYARLEDELRFGSRSTAQSGPTLGTQIDVSDHFGSRNRFHGFELGLAYVGRPTPLWEAEMVAKVALGRTLSQFDIQGETTITTATPVSVAMNPSGLLTQSSNSGSFDSSRFGAMAEFGVSLRRDLPGGFQATFGYTFIHWGSVMRAHDQIDSSINQAQIPPANPAGELRPMVPSEKSSYWAQGLNFGLSYDF